MNQKEDWMNKIELINGECLEKMKDIPDKSIDMILCDYKDGLSTTCISMNGSI